MRATPLLLAGLGVTLAFRAGVWNIGAEGQLLVGAAAAAIVALATQRALGGMTVPLALLAGAARRCRRGRGSRRCLRQRFGVLEVISTIMLNFIAVYLIGYLVRGPMQEPTHIYPQSAALDPVAHLPRLVPGHAAPSRAR